jgi:hypothetical protein
MPSAARARPAGRPTGSEMGKPHLRMFEEIRQGPTNVPRPAEPSGRQRHLGRGPESLLEIGQDIIDVLDAD